MSSDEKAEEQWKEHASRRESLQTGVGDYRPGSEAEKKLLRKLDMRIIVRRPSCLPIAIELMQ